MIFPKTFFLSLLVLAPASVLSSNKLLRHEIDERELLDVPEICGYTTKWDWEGDGYKHPVVPCLGHDDCVGFTDTGGWEPCCMFHDCLCGSVQSLFTPGVLHCGRFACQTDDQCSPGLCKIGQCNFDNIEPCCREHTDCGGSAQCHNGMCFEVEDTGFIRLNNGFCPSGNGATQTGRNPSNGMGMMSRRKK